MRMKRSSAHCEWHRQFFTLFRIKMILSNATLSIQQFEIILICIVSGIVMELNGL